MPRCASLRPKSAPLQKGTPGPELSPSKNNRLKKMCVQTGLDAEFERGRWRRIIKTTLGTLEELLPAVGDNKMKILQWLGWKCNRARESWHCGTAKPPFLQGTGEHRWSADRLWKVFHRDFLVFVVKIHKTKQHGSDNTAKAVLQALALQHHGTSEQRKHPCCPQIWAVNELQTPWRKVGGGGHLSLGTGVTEPQTFHAKRLRLGQGEDEKSPR